MGDTQAGLRAAAAGANTLIAQGVEAGGHVQSQVPLDRLVRDLRAAVAVPVLAAGGISDAARAAAAMAAGAAGVMDGTAYLAADEADVHPVYRNELVAARGSDTRLTTLFDVGWPKAPHGVLRNPTFEAWQAAGSPPPGERPGENQTVATRAGQSIVRYSDAQPTRDTTGDIRAMALYAGTGVEHIHHNDAAATITARLLAATSTSK